MVGNKGNLIYCTKSNITKKRRGVLSVFFAVPRKIESLVPWLSHVREAGSHITLLSEHVHTTQTM